MPITDLTGTKWLLNSELSYETDDPVIPTESIFAQVYAYDSTAWYEDRDTFEIGSDGVNAGHLNFTSNNENFIGLVSATYAPLDGGNYIRVYEMGVLWTNEAYRTIEITGGTDATNTNLINWLQENATQIIEPQPTDTNKISVGTLKLAKAFIGNSEVASMWLGNVKIYEKASSYDYNYSNGTLTIENAPYNYSDGVLTIE